MEWYLKALRQYADFEGRARRQEFWMFVLFNIFIKIAISYVDRMFGLRLDLNQLYSLIVLLPSLAVSVRRLHDIGKSGWMLLLALIPILGWIWLIILYATEGEPGDNEFGPDPINGPEDYFD